MSLPKITPRLPNIIVLRKAHAITPSARPPNPKIIEEARGTLVYARNISRSHQYTAAAAQQQGDTPYRFQPSKTTILRFFFRRLGHAYETYPLFGLVGFWLVIFGWITYRSMTKIEIWLDRSKDTAPWDWSRIRDNYWKQPTVLSWMLRPTEGFGVTTSPSQPNQALRLFSFGSYAEKTHSRLEIMEKLQDELLEAAKKRGTR